MHLHQPTLATTEPQQTRAPGTPEGVHGAELDQLRRLRALVERSEEVLSRVLRATNDGWWDVDLVADTAFHAERWWQIHGYEPGELPDTVTIARGTDPPR